MRTFATQRQKLVERRHICFKGLVLSTPATPLVFHGGFAAFSPPLKISFISGTALKEAIKDRGLGNEKGRGGEGCGGTLGLGAGGNSWGWGSCLGPPSDHRDLLWCSVWECILRVLGVLRPGLAGDLSGDIALSQDRPRSWLLSCNHAAPEGPSRWVCTWICQLQRKAVGAGTWGKNWDLWLFSFPKAALLLPSPLC